MPPNSTTDFGLKQRKSSSTISLNSLSLSLSLSSSKEFDGNQNAEKPLLPSFTTKSLQYINNKRRTKSKTSLLIWMLVQLLKIAAGAFILSVIFFLLFLFVMSLYNGRTVRDPCMVAETSKQQIVQSAFIQRDIMIQTDPTSPASIAIAEANKLSSSSSSPSHEYDAVVPKIIHQQWKTNTVPVKFMKWRKKWLTLYPEPEYTHMLWTDKNGRELIEMQYPWFLETYDSYEHNINRADAARYFILHHYGGIYADLDYEPQSNFYEHLPPNQVAMVESPYYWNEKTQNCLMSSPKNDPFWVDLFTVLIKNSKKDEVLEATGPILLDEAMEYSVHPSYILPCENFQRVPLGEYDQTLWTTVYDREIMFRLKPISKNCGYYSNDQCHFGKHHNTVSYRTTSGRVL